MMIENERLLEGGADNAVADARGDFAKIQAARRLLRASEQNAESALEIGGAGKIGAGFRDVHFDEENGGASGEGREEIVVARGIEGENRIELEHVSEDTTGRERKFQGTNAEDAEREGEE
jgi:hypothetical protein